MKNTFVLLVLILMMNNLWGQFHPLPKDKLSKFELNLKDYSIEELKGILYENLHSSKFPILMKEFQNRDDEIILNILKEYLNFEDSKLRGMQRDQFKALTEIAIAYIESENNNNLLQRFDKLLLNEASSMLIEMVASELYKIGGTNATNLLKKHQELKPSVRLYWLKLQTKEMSDSEFVKYVCLETKNRISNSESNSLELLVAERSVLVNRFKHKTILKLLESEKTNIGENPNVNYKNFIDEMIQHFKEILDLRSSINHIPKHQEEKENSSSGQTQLIENLKKETPFENRNTPEVLQILAKSNFTDFCKGLNHKNEDCVKLRTIAQELGDRHLAGNLSLNAEQRITIDNTVKEYLKLVISEEDNDWEEAKLQMYRFWTLAAPMLLKNMDNSDKRIARFAAQTLIEMRNEQIIKKIIEKANTNTNSRKEKFYIITLEMMKNQFIIQIPNRQSMSKEETEKLYNELIEPALGKLKEK